MPTPNPITILNPKPDVNSNPRALYQVLKESDVVIPMCSLTAATGGLLGYNELAKMKSTAYTPNPQP